VVGVTPVSAECNVDHHRDFEFDGAGAELRHEVGLFGITYRQFERVVHLQQWDDAFTPARAHPQFCVCRRRTLDERVHR
jgi:hypothetical protein